MELKQKAYESIMQGCPKSFQSRKALEMLIFVRALYFTKKKQYSTSIELPITSGLENVFFPALFGSLT